MIYPQSIEQKLGFDKIRQMLNDQCTSALGRSFVAKMKFNENHSQVKKTLEQTHEMFQILNSGVAFPNNNYLDVTASLNRVAIIGGILNEEEFYELQLSLRTIYECLQFLREKTEQPYPQLQELAGLVLVQNASEIEQNTPTVTIEQIYKWISNILDDRGKIKDNASPDLAKIRKLTNTIENDLRKKLDGIFKNARANGWITDDFSLTVRNGRLVIPIQAEYKRKIKGFVHDESDTGKTVFLEPAEVLELNNELKELEAAERREIIKILSDLSAKIQPYVPLLKKAYHFLGIIDFVRSKAKLAIELDAILPQFVPSPILKIRKGRHPLLFLSFKNQGKSVVPLQLFFNDEKQVLLVSGPNAGGKSVMLKTVGLLQYMLQCGLLVPVAEGTQMGTFRNLFIDIGDEQNLENDLSTYSSHLSNMKYFLENAQKQTLFLIDEFGTGTEPSLGGAIAESILEELLHTKAYGVINTHYTNLKSMADRHPAMQNAAMRFNAAQLLPSFELEIGQPGSSFALEIAEKIGLGKKVVDKAKAKLGNKQVNFEKMLKELEVEKKQFEEKNASNKKLEIELKQNLNQYTQLKNLLEGQKKAIINTAKTEAQSLVKQANQKIEATIKEIKEFKADKEITKIVREELLIFETKELKLEHVPVEMEPTKVEKTTMDPVVVLESGVIEVGNLVKVKGQDTVAEVLSLKGKDAEIAIGGLKSLIKLNRLEKISKKDYKNSLPKEEIKSMKGVSMNDKMSNFSFNLDLRGRRGDESLALVDTFIDDAIMLGYPELRILHGKGDGILRNLVRNHLKKYKQVHKMADEHADRGGAGVTLITMK